jgi:hypothetical protein
MTESQPARQNRDGHSCPPWCQTDHDEVHGPAGTYGFHGGPVTRIEVDGRTSIPDEIITRAFDAGYPGGDVERAAAEVGGKRDALGQALGGHGCLGLVQQHDFLESRPLCRVAQPGLGEFLPLVVVRAFGADERDRVSEDDAAHVRAGRPVGCPFQSADNDRDQVREGEVGGPRVRGDEISVRQV